MKKMIYVLLSLFFSIFVCVFLSLHADLKQERKEVTKLIDQYGVSLLLGTDINQDREKARQLINEHVANLSPEERAEFEQKVDELYSLWNIREKAEFIVRAKDNKARDKAKKELTILMNNESLTLDMKELINPAIGIIQRTSDIHNAESLKALEWLLSTINLFYVSPDDPELQLYFLHELVEHAKNVIEGPFIYRASEKRLVIYINQNLDEKLQDAIRDDIFIILQAAGKIGMREKRMAKAYIHLYDVLSDKEEELDIAISRNKVKKMINFVRKKMRNTYRWIQFG